MKNLNSGFYKDRYFLLGMGVLLTALTGMRFNVSLAAWLLPVPFLAYLRLGHPKKWLLLALVAGFTLQIAKISSEPFYIFIALVGGPLSGLTYWAVLILKDKIRLSLGEGWSVLVYPMLIAITEIAGAYTSPLGTWGMMSNTMLDNLQLIQLASLTGAVGISFLVSWAGALLEWVAFGHASDKQKMKLAVHSGAYLLILMLVYIYGAWRLDQQLGSETIRAAAVSSKKYGVRQVMGSEADRAANNADVLRLVEIAAREKPSLIVTNEGALFLSPEELEGTLGDLAKISRSYNTDIAAGYIIYRGRKEKFQNRSVWISRGEVLQDYHKQFIPPGEPSLKMPSEIRSVQTPFGPASLAICYDFDSLSITSAHGKLGLGSGNSGVSLVALPSSDWRGIDPVHTQMARLRAIENGYSVIRPVRYATSAVYDGLGRTRAMSRWYETNNEIMTALIPAKPVPTLYKTAGNWFFWLNLAAAAFVMFRVFVKKPR